MKLLSFFILVSAITTLAANSYSQQTKFNISFRSATVREVLQKIEDSSEFIFLYSEKSVDVDRKVDVNVTDQTVDVVLDQLFNGTRNFYEIRNRQISILEKGSTENSYLKIGTESGQQQKSVSGKVTDPSGGSLPGVSVVVKGTTTGTITDANGKYSISNIPANATLQFSFVGMKTQEIKFIAQSSINVVLADETIGLDEVVAIGYGTVKKSDLTGAVTSVKSNEIKAFATSNVMQSLSGRASGIQVMQNTGAPGGSVSVRIRGTNSIQGSNEPLYVIDGFPYSSSSPSVLSNNDIESIEILKDASSTAIYGSRGANGVVLITTKHGKIGKTTIDFESSFGVQTLRKKLDLMNAKEYSTFYNEQAANDKLTAFFTQDQINNFGEGFDWQDFIFVTAPIKNNTLSINGGNEKTKFSVSGTLFDQDGIVKNSDYKKYTLKAYFTHEINNVLSLDFGATLTRNTTSRQNSGGGNRGYTLMSAIISAPPTLTPYNDDGTYRVLNTAYPFISNVLVNPLDFINELRDNAEANIVLANTALIFKPIKGLTLKIYGGIENNDGRSDYYQTRNYVNSTGYASVSTTNSMSLLNENTLNYNKTFGERHSLSAVAGFTYQDFLYRSLGGSGTGFLSDITETSDLGSASTPGVPWSSYSKSVLLSYLGRINYSFNNRYLFTASIRADGSSKYSEGSKWGYFPSCAFAWKVKEENFMKNVDFVSDLKFRSSYGFTGSQAISPYATLNQLSSSKTVFGDALYTTFAPNTTLPGLLKWETTEQIDLGFDIAVLNNRFRLTADAYLKNTRDLLNSVVLPSSLGYARTIRNVGQIRNGGLEFSADANLFSEEFKWNINVNIAFNQSKVIKLYGGQDILAGDISAAIITDNTSLLREGEPMSVFYGYKKNGYDANGKEIYKDLSGPNGVPDDIISPYDKTIIGNPNPDFIYGLNSTMSYKNFELTVFFQGSQGNDIVNVSAIGSNLDYGYGLNMTRDVYLNHWTPTNTDAKYPMLTRSQSLRFSDRLVEDGSFLRLKNIQLSYSLPIQKIGINWMRNLQVYASGQNLLTLTKYSWWDPEVNSQGGSNSVSQGIDNYSYPTAKTVTFGIKVGF